MWNDHMLLPTRMSLDSATNKYINNAYQTRSGIWHPYKGHLLRTPPFLFHILCIYQEQSNENPESAIKIWNTDQLSVSLQQWYSRFKEWLTGGSMRQECNTMAKWYCKDGGPACNMQFKVFIWLTLVYMVFAFSCRELQI